MGIGDLKSVVPPTADSGDTLKRRAWLDFCCQSLADSYHDLARYARTQRKDILVECNPGGPGDRIQPPVDHGRLLTGGEAFWDEGATPGLREGVWRTRIRTFKVARAFDNLAFTYTTTPLEAAEAMAFNLDCLGCICWFEYGKLVALPGSTKPVSSDLAPFVRFYNTRRDLFRDTAGIADVAILRSFASQVFAAPKWAQLTGKTEQALIEQRVPFQIVYDRQLGELQRYRAVVLAGCIALSDQQIKLLKRYVASGGRLCIIGPVATHDQWLNLRPKPGLEDFPADRVTQFSESEDAVSAVRQSHPLSCSVEGPRGLCTELAAQDGRRLLHLVNYRSDTPVTNAVAQLLLPLGKRATSVRLLSPEHQQDQALAFRQETDSVTFTVPIVNVYEVAVVEF